jgi:hypothetical protein
MSAKAVFGCLLSALLLVFVAGPVPAQASRALIIGYIEDQEELLKTEEGKTPIPPPAGEIEGACGLAIPPGSGGLYVSDYYHRRVDIFGLSGGYQSQITLPGTEPVFGVKTLDGVCGLAFDSAGNLYANEFHERVLRLTPTERVFDPSEPIAGTNESTGVAVGSDDNIYVDDRTYVAVYEPSGAPVLREGQPLRIGAGGSLEDGYGVAAFEGKVYVPDAADNTIKVYEPAVEPLEPAFTIDGPGGNEFVSLVDAAVAVDPTNGHLLAVDNLQPGYTHPEAAIYEFDASGTFLGRLPGGPQVGGPIDGEPSGLAVDPASGELYVTTGNGEKSNVFAYGPYTASGSLATPPSGESSGAGAFAAARRPSAQSSPAPSPAASASEVAQRRGVRVSFDGKLTPHALPRRGAAPVGIAVGVTIVATGDSASPQLRKIAIAINRNGRFNTQGLPVCHLDDIQPSTTANALAACRSSLVGEGHFSANVKLPEQSPFPSAGKILAFNGRLRGKPAIFAHIYGTEPAPTSTVLPFLIKGAHGTYGTVLEASLPQATGSWGYVTGLKMNLRRSFTYRGKGRSYLSAGCPAPAGFSSAAFRLARTSFVFAGGPTLRAVLNRSCKAKG